MRKFRIPYIPYRSLLLSTTVLNDIYIYTSLVSFSFLPLVPFSQSSLAFLSDSSLNFLSHCFL